MKRRTLTLALVCALATSVSAQMGNASKDSFDKFRQGLMTEYNDFRDKILEDYDQFLDGIWKEYKQFLGVERDPKPKPFVVPRYEVPVTPLAPVRVKPVVVTPQLDPLKVKPIDVPLPKPVPMPIPTPERPVIEYQEFNFYGLSVKVEQIDYAPLVQVEAGQYGENWRQLKQLKVERRVLPALQQVALACGLNDYFCYELIEAYVDAALARASAEKRISLLHYLMTHQGFDARIARSGQTPLLVLPIEQMVYARSFLNMGEQRFFIFTDKLSGKVELGDSGIYSCSLPENADAGRALNLIIRPLHMPKRMKAFSISYDGMVLRGEVNTTLIDMVRHYPQMPIPDYARSVLDRDIRKSLVEQTRQQLEGYQGMVAVNRLLRFVQMGFEYATDQEQHGYEKPYFVEEILFYPKCDCEDRSVFFAYLTKEVLAVDNCLIQYPGHECTAIVRNDMSGGDGFTLRGLNYYITDPTYLGADAGCCMPQYRETQPEVQFWY